MGEAWALRAFTLCVLLTTTGGFTFLPRARPLAASLHRGRRCNSALSRARIAPFCAVAVDRGTSVDEKGDTSDEAGISSADHVHDGPDGTPAIPPPPPPPPPPQAEEAAAEEGGVLGVGERHGGEEQQRGVATLAPLPHQPGEDGGDLEVPQPLPHPTGEGVKKVVAEGETPAGQTAAAAAAATAAVGDAGAPPATAGVKARSKTADKKRARAGRRPSKVGVKGPKKAGVKGPKGNPSIGKSKLDLILGDTAKTGVLFGGDERATSAVAAAGEKAAKQAAVAKTTTDTEVDEEEDDYEEDVATLPFTARWRRRVVFAARTVQIWAFLFHVLIKLLRQKLVQMDEARMSARRRKLGRYLCKAFLKLGPTFIKIGQLLSTRVDLLSTEYIEELQQLQDNVPGFGGKRAIKIIEKELGAPITELFDSFNATSLAAASLGQVHEAWLDGKRYAVKVQRPGLKKLFEVDLNSIGALAGVLDRYDPKLDGASRDWGAIFRESSRVLYEEIDYMREGRNAERFSENFKDTEWIKAPSINWSRSSGKVLCMEYVQGIKINNVEAIEKAGVNRSLLATRTAECYLEQLIRHGFFHCDPHPGNLACDAVGGGRIIFYDFGMMDELTRPLKRSFSDLIFGIYGNNLKEVVDSLEEMDVIRKGADRMTVERVTRFYLGEFQTTLTKGGKYINQMDPEEEKALIRRERAQIGQDLFSGQAAIPLQFPASFTFVFRAFTTLDGIGKTLDSGYDLTKIAGPYLKELLDLKDGNVYVSVLKDWQRKLGWRREDVASVVQSPRRVQHVDKVVTKLEEGDLKLRVRVLESEAAFARIEAVQGSLSSAVMATLLLNAGVLMAPGGGGAVRPAAVMASRAMLAMAGFFGLKIPVGYFKVWQLNRQANNAKGFR